MLACHLILLLLCSLVGACAILPQRYTHDDAQQAGMACQKQSIIDSTHNKKDWILKAAICLEVTVLPIQVYLHKEKEKELRQIFSTFKEQARLVSEGKTSLDDAYVVWDKTLREQMELRCFVSTQQANGKIRCVSYVPQNY